jgi:hypothetical protein
MQFYTYLWLREDGTPYYVGKGSGQRAWRIGCPPHDRILVQFYPDETSAFAAEIFLIAFYGRKDLGTGCLRNMTDGGEGSCGWVASLETRRRMARSGFNNPMFGRERLDLAQWNRENRRGKTGAETPTFGLKRTDLADWNSKNLKGKKIGPPSAVHRSNLSRAILQWWERRKTRGGAS